MRCEEEKLGVSMGICAKSSLHPQGVGPLSAGIRRDAGARLGGRLPVRVNAHGCYYLTHRRYFAPSPLRMAVDHAVAPAVA